MAANEFERSMRKVMDEFKLHPSNEVWDKVEERIRERKRKRRIIFFTILSCVGLAVGGYAINESTHHVNENLSQQIHQPASAEATAGEANKKQPASTEATAGEATKKQPASTEATSGKSTKKQPASAETTPDKSTKKQPASAEATSGKGTKNQPASAEATAGEANKNQPASAEAIAGEANKNQPASTEATSGKANKNQAASAEATSGKANKNQPASADVTAGKTANYQQRAAGKQRPTFGFYVSLGSSSIKQDPLPSIFSANADKALQTGAYGAPGSATGSPAPSPPHPQSKSRGSLAFKLGVSAQKQISKRSALKIGAGYAFMGDRITTGTVNTSNAYLLNQFAIASFFGSDTGQHKNFADRFHFIELPITYQWRVTGNSKHFLAVEGGFTPSYLFSSNALVYDTAGTGIYYHNNKTFSRFNASAIAGLSYRFIANGMDINVGPHISLPLNEIIKSDIDQRNYLIYGGIGASIYFQKKKKK